MRYPPGHPYHPESIDLAFEITSSGNPYDPDPAADLGDAPDSTNTSGLAMTAYPGVNANFPTVYVAGSPPPGPIHWQPLAVAYLGPMVSLELEADTGQDQDILNNINPPADTPDQDSAPVGGDDGVVNMPIALPHCQFTSFDYLVNVVNPGFGLLYVNVWFDWNRDGDWDDIQMCGAKLVPEWAVQNQVLFNLPVGISQITTPGFMCWHPNPGIDDPIWMRITVSEKVWTGLAYAGMVGNGGSCVPGGYTFGETEDYYFAPNTSPQQCDADLDNSGFVNFLDFAILANDWLEFLP
jgi:hypothetical protein